MSLTMARRRVVFEVAGIAQPKGSAKAFVPKSWAAAAVAQGKAPRAVVTSDNPRAKEWQALVAAQAQTVANGELFTGPVVLTVTFRLPRPQSLPRAVLHHTKKPDSSKLLRCLEDALTGILLRDDAQIVEHHIAKWYAPVGTTPTARVVLEEAADPDPAQLDVFQERSLFS